MPSAAFRLAASTVDPDDDVLEGLVLTHPDAPTPVRLVNDAENHTIAGHLHTGLRMAIVWPDQTEDRRPRARLAVDNVGRELTQWIELTRGLAGGRVTLLRALASTGAIEQSVTLDVGGASIGPDVVSVELGFGLNLSALAVAVRWTPDTAPGLF